jgi:hypothetical protein
MSFIFLGWWTSQTIKDFTQGQYMGVYAGICEFVQLGPVPSVN